MEFAALDRLGLSGLLSQVGKKVYLPQGIFYWTGRAKKEGKPGLNGTIGSAFVTNSELYEGGDERFVIAHLPAVHSFFPGIDPADIYAYAPICGTPGFREAWRQWTIFKAGETYAHVADRLTLPIVVPGITGAISLCARLFLDPGERMICPVQRWENYDTVVTMNLGIEFAEYPHFSGNEFNVQGFVDTVDSVLRSSHRAVAILNFPNNPTGYNPTRTLVRDRLVPAAREIVRRHNKPLVLLFDDAYEGYVYDDESMPVSPFFEFVNVDERLIPVKLDGVSKELLWYGGRVGTITFGVSDAWKNQVSVADLSKDLDNKIGGMVRGTVSNSPHVVQTVASKVLAQPQALCAQRQATIAALKRRYQALVRALPSLPKGVSADPFQGGFFFFLNLEGVDATAVAEHMIAQHGVTVVPAGNAEHGWNGLRIAYCGIDEKHIPAVMAAVGQSVEALRGK